MAGRWVHVDLHRIEAWVAGFADRAGGASLHAGGEHTVLLEGNDGTTARLTRWPLPGPEPVAGDASDAGARSALRQWCEPPEHLGLVLVRRGGYAVGLARAGTLVSHKSGTSYVQSRTAAGGTSQQRFARRRGNQADALVGTVTELAVRHLLPRSQGRAGCLPDAVVLGGDRRLAERVIDDDVLHPIAHLPRRVFADLPDPRFAVLQTALTRARAVPILLG